MDTISFPTDDKTTLADLRQAVSKFVAARDWEQFHSAKNLSMSIAIEAAELMEHFQWLTLRESLDYQANPDNRREIAEELADIMIYCLSFANQADIDISQAILGKLQKNETRFPPGK
ncbi:MAG: nucleotide pyrophosphohydrolase [Anaerolineales bacterium]|nr:nucleotide pyrophosphohydrolase [Anaerolineales bacterium]